MGIRFKYIGPCESLLAGCTSSLTSKNATVPCGQAYRIPDGITPEPCPPDRPDDGGKFLSPAGSLVVIGPTPIGMISCRRSVQESSLPRPFCHSSHFLGNHQENVWIGAHPRISRSRGAFLVGQLFGSKALCDGVSRAPRPCPESDPVCRCRPRFQEP